jgi:hypothetical protein
LDIVQRRRDGGRQVVENGSVNHRDHSLASGWHPGLRRSRPNLDRHRNYILAAYMASGT